MFICLLLSISCIISLKSIPFVFLSLGLHTLCIVVLLGASQSSDTVLTYFLPAVVGSLLWFLGTLPSLVGLGVSLLGLILKISSFPFHFWGLKLVRNLPISLLFVIMRPAKLPIIFLIVSSFSYSSSLAYCLLIVGILGFLVSHCVSHFLVWSSHLTLGMFLFISGFVFILFLLVYNFCILLLMFGRHLSASSSFACLTLAGLPPFYLFWVKILFLYSLPLYLCCLFLLAFAARALGWVFLGSQVYLLSRCTHTSLGVHFLLICFLAQHVCSLFYL